MRILPRPWKSDWSVRGCADAAPRPSRTAGADDAGGRQRPQHGQRDRAAEHGTEITDVVGSDTDARDGKARVREDEIHGDRLRAGLGGPAG